MCVCMCKLTINSDVARMPKNSVCALVYTKDRTEVDASVDISLTCVTCVMWWPHCVLVTSDRVPLSTSVVTTLLLQ